MRMKPPQPADWDSQKSSFPGADWFFRFFERWMPLGGAEAGKYDWDEFKADDWSKLKSTHWDLPPGYIATPVPRTETSIEALARMVS